MIRLTIRAAVMAVFVALAVNGAWAFDGNEHALIADHALVAAWRMMPPSEAMEQAVLDLQSSDWPFSTVTVGVDWFRSAPKLANPEVKDRALRRRKWNYLMRGLAIHHNETHFQTDAVLAWQKNHATALHVASCDPMRALLSEAVALHYLQDFFSAGHLATPRRGMHNAAAGDLHDHFNERGLGFRIQSSSDLDAILAAAAVSPEEKAAYDAALCDVIRFHGDGDLRENDVQRLFVLAVSALSIAEVFAASHQPAQATANLQLCAQRRSACADEIRESRTLTTARGPDGGVALSREQRPDPGTILRCVDRPWLGRYLSAEDPALKESDYVLNGFVVRADRSLGRRSAGIRRMLEIRFFGLAQDPPGTMDDEQGRPAQPKLRWMQMQLASAGPSYIWGNDYRAWGFLWDVAYGTNLRGVSWSTRYGPRFYSYDDNNAVPRIDIGAKISIGVEIINLTVGVDRSYEVDRNGSFGPAYFASFGVELTAPESYSRYTGPISRVIHRIVPDLRNATLRARDRKSKGTRR
jgi:hypothetical protein